MLVLLVAWLITPRLDWAWAKPSGATAGDHDGAVAAIDLNAENDTRSAVYIEASESPGVTKVKLPGMLAAFAPGFSLDGIGALESCTIAMGRFDAPADRSWIEACNRGPPWAET